MSTSSSTYEKRLQYCSIILFLNSLALTAKKIDGPMVVASFCLSLVLLAICAVLFFKMRNASKLEKQERTGSNQQIAGES